MKNSDMPAMPQDYELFCNAVGICPTEGTGLTKREYFAGQVMQGLASDGQFEGDLEQVAKISVSWADALLTELEKPNA